MELLKLEPGEVPTIKRDYDFEFAVRVAERPMNTRG
jgi:hypothetical protein